MTINDCIKRVCELRPNGLTQQQLVQFINTCNAQAIRDTSGEQNVPEYQLPEDEQQELYIPFPYDDAYVLYTAAQISLMNADMSLYANDASAFNERYMEFITFWHETHTPEQNQWKPRWFA